MPIGLSTLFFAGSGGIKQVHGADSPEYNYIRESEAMINRVMKNVPKNYEEERRWSTRALQSINKNRPPNSKPYSISIDKKGKLRLVQWVPDTNATIKKKPKPGEINKLPDIIDHEELFKYYPELKDFNYEVVEEFKDAPRQRGAYLSSKKLIQQKNDIRDFEGLNTFLHEIDHGTGDKEGLVFGTNPKEAGSFQEYYQSPGERKARFSGEKGALEMMMREDTDGLFNLFQ